MARTCGRRAALVLLAVTLGCAAASAQELSMRRYTVAQGIAHDNVTSIIQDSRGYIWVGTFEGVSRFDGYGFKNYSTRDGLGTYVINDLIEDPQGRIWVATNGGGVARLNDGADVAPEARFTSYLPGPGGAVNVNRLVIDRDGRLWCGTDAGVYVTNTREATPHFSLVGFPSGAATAGTETGGRVWFGLRGVGLVEFGGAAPKVYAVPWAMADRIWSLAPDGEDGVLVATESGMYDFADGKFERKNLPLVEGEVVVDILPEGGGGYWLATTHDLLHLNRAQATRYPVNQGVTRLAVDAAGRLWVALSRAGLGSLGPQQIFSYRKEHGLPDVDVASLTETGQGMRATSRTGVMSLIDRDGVHTAGTSVAGFRRQTAGHAGWWGVSSRGVFHASAGARPVVTRLPLSVTPALTIPSANALIHADAARSIWFATTEPALYQVSDPLSVRRRVSRWPLPSNGPLPYAVIGIDPAGGVWLGNMGMLARFVGGRLDVIPPPAGLDNIQPRALFVDSRGAVWIGLRFGGVMVTDAPATTPVAFRRYSTTDGLGSDAVMAIAEDRHGVMYFGTGRGLDLFDRTSGLIRHLTTGDGLAGNVVTDVEVDAAGRVWVSAVGGVSRLDLSFAPIRKPAVPVYISRLQLAGVDRPLPERGTTALQGIALASGARHLRIEFVSPIVQPTGRVAYQYRLDGVHSEWSAPSYDHVVTYGTLPAGGYRFEVRAVASDGRVSDSPATVSFVIRRPIYAEAWFILLVAASMLGLAFALHWTRRQRRRSLEAIRRQLATDLHDDVGSGLAQIAILTEVARRDAGGVAPQLGEVADLARSMRESMSDIVWAVDPSRDAPFALVHRMRQVVYNLLPPTTEVTFTAPAEETITGPDLPSDRRRQVLLIFKEAVTNIARHSSATEVAITLQIDRDRLDLTVEDNGAGFDRSSDREGHGLDNMSSRAQALGGTLAIDGLPGRGCRIVLSIPLRRHASMISRLPWPFRVSRV